MSRGVKMDINLSQLDLSLNWVRLEKEFIFLNVS